VSGPAQPNIGVILGARVCADGTASAALERRARHGARLFASGVIGGVIASGGQGRAPRSEASLIREICLKHGVPKARILVEDQASNTRENIRFSARLAPEGARLLLITDRYHAPRARLIARRMGLAVRLDCPAPARLSPLRLVRARMREALAYAWTFATCWNGAGLHPGQ